MKSIRTLRISSTPQHERRQLLSVVSKRLSDAEGFLMAEGSKSKVSFLGGVTLNTNHEPVDAVGIVGVQFSPETDGNDEATETTTTEEAVGTVTILRHGANGIRQRTLNLNPGKEELDALNRLDMAHDFGDRVALSRFVGNPYERLAVLHHVRGALNTMIDASGMPVLPPLPELSQA